MTPFALLTSRSRVRGHLDSESDERLVALAALGSEAAFEAIVTRYRLPLTRYCARVAPAGQAEDTVQETFVKAFKALDRGERVLNLGAWLYRIAHNTALNSLRAERRHDQPLDNLVEGADTTTADVERRLGLRETVSAVQALPVRQRNVIVQHELEGRSYEEIATGLGVSTGTVRQLLNRARTSLRAGAAALVAPLAALSRLATSMADAPAVGRVAELAGTGGSGVAAKLCATAVLTGAIAGGIQPVAEVTPDIRVDDGAARAAVAPRSPSGGNPAEEAPPRSAPASPRASSRRSNTPTRPRRRAITSPGRHGQPLRPRPRGHHEDRPGRPHAAPEHRAPPSGERVPVSRDRQGPALRGSDPPPPQQGIDAMRSGSIAPPRPGPSPSGDGPISAGEDPRGDFLR